MDQSHIRNFCIIAHIDHGKSTLADRLLEITGTVAARQMSEQMLDTMDLERERGITIKATAVVNKIALASAEPERVAAEITDVIGFAREEVLFVSAKEGTGVPGLLEAVVARIPPPRGDPEAPLRALIFDSKYDSYKGVIAYLRVVDGRVSTRRRLRLMATNVTVEPLETGVFRPTFVPIDGLTAGQVGYLSTRL